MKTRTFAILCGLALSGAISAGAAESSQPDILFLMPDQWRGASGKRKRTRGPDL
jgi:hypothetical protein